MKKGTLLRHYKGGVYKVQSTATHSESAEEMLVYKNLKDGKLWVRPEAMFHETVTVDGVQVPRFKVINSLGDGN